MGVNRDKQLDYFSGVGYREPTHPVVMAYALPKIAYVLKKITLPSNARILDVGCGGGVFTHHLCRISDFVIGLDFSTHLLARNQHTLKVCGNAANLPFADRSFDMVFEANLLHHVTDRQNVIAAMKRVTRRYVVLIEPNRLNPVMFAFSLAVRAERGGLNSSARMLRRLVEESGLKCLSAMTTGMISQNNTPEFLVPFLKRFDKEITWGEYVVLIAEK
ncbi:MAG TPA: class I SAM-dependent methyltransferase [Terriglobales bacterium]|nr:class I SAM-dependent methyltransferase [Terriglobales bacterium]